MSTRFVSLLMVAALGLITPLFAQPVVPAKDDPYVTAVELLKPQWFPDASYGMAVEDARDGDVATVTTTGAEFSINKATGEIECTQRIPEKRTVAKIKLPAGAMTELKLSHKSSGAAIFTGGKTTIRINGDSLLQISPGADGAITAELAFTPDYFSQYKGNFNCFDPVGGISFFDHTKQDAPKVEALNDPVKITWDWKAGDVLWAGVSPPKPYDWEKSFKQRIIHRGSSFQQYMYPDELALKWMSRIGKFNVFYLHAENIWTNWQREFIPRDTQKYRQMMLVARAEKIPVMVYASPKHFIEGTVREENAVDDVDDPRAAGHTTGSNARLFVYQAKRLIERFETGGLYFDEMYCSPVALASTYYVTRSCRNLLGDEGPYVYHATEDALGARNPGDLVGTTHCPTIHSYFDAIYKGEGIGMPGQPTWNTIDEKFPGYIRYNMGTHNISNAIAIPVLDRGHWIEGPLLEMLLTRANARVIMMENFLYGPESAAWWRDYIPRLKPELQKEIEPTLLKRTGAFDAWRKQQKASTQR